MAQASESPWRLVAGTGQNVAIGAASVASTAVGALTHAVQISALGNCHIRIGTAPVAVATDTLVKATDPPRVFACGPGDKVAVIQDGSATGNCNITELTH
ncbi:MAG: hypothetical protein KGL39_31095 [Patescibacteria group bacterium]|nr:hypothetical protein [Patescibacteria group bacterium]